MKIRYIDSDGPEHTSTQGYAFKRGEWVEVTDGMAIIKLSRNPGFEVFKESEEVQPVQEVVEPVVITPKRRGRPRLR